MFNMADGVFFLTTIIMVFIAGRTGSLQFAFILLGMVFSTYLAQYLSTTVHLPFYALFLAGSILSALIGILVSARVDYILPGRLESIAASALGLCVGVFFCMSVYIPFAGRFFSREAPLIKASWFQNNVVPRIETLLPPSRNFNISRYRELSLIDFTAGLGFDVESEGSFIREQAKRRVKPLKDLK